MINVTKLRTTTIISSWGKKQKLKSNGRLPQFHITDRYWDVIRHLPNDCTVPSSLVKIGIITDDIYTTSWKVVLDSSLDSINRTPRIHLRPKTVSEFRRFMVNILDDDLDDSKKHNIGCIINTSGLGIHPLDSDGFDDSSSNVPYQGIRIKMPHEDLLNGSEITTENQTQREKVTDKITSIEDSKQNESILNDLDPEKPH